MHLSKLRETLLESELTGTGLNQRGEIRQAANGSVLSVLSILGSMCAFQNGWLFKICVSYSQLSKKSTDFLDEEFSKRRN